MSFADLWTSLIEQRLKTLNIGITARVEAFSMSKLTVDVVPLLSVEAPDGSMVPFPKISGVRCGLIVTGDHFIRPTYKSGDLVWLSFSTHDQAQAFLGQQSRSAGRLFSPENCVVVCGIPKVSELPSAATSEDGLLIGQLDGAAYLQINDGKFKFVFQGGQETIIDSTGVASSGFVKANKDASPISLGTHTHTTTVPGSPTTPPTAGT